MPTLTTEKTKEDRFWIQDPSRLKPLHQQLIVMFAIPRATLCWAFQFDGPGFTETIVWGWDDAQSK